jgi:hypothetical protein
VKNGGKPPTSVIHLTNFFLLDNAKQEPKAGDDSDLDNELPVSEVFKEKLTEIKLHILGDKTKPGYHEQLWTKIENYCKMDGIKALKVETSKNPLFILTKYNRTKIPPCFRLMKWSEINGSKINKKPELRTALLDFLIPKMLYRLEKRVLNLKNYELKIAKKYGQEEAQF